MERWYLIQFKSNSFRLAERNLIQQGFKTFLPMYGTTQRRASKFSRNSEPLFPGYIFAKFDTKIVPWQKINNTIGVSRLVSFDNKPSPLPNDFMEALMLKFDHYGKLKMSENFTKGDTIKILTGPLATFIATIESIDSDKRIWAVMEFLGQKSKVDVTSEHLMRFN